MSKKLLIIILFIIIIAGLSFAFFSKSKNSLINKTENNRFNNFEISDIEECQAEGGFRAICATVKNNSETNYKFVQVKINLFDENGNLIENTTSSINDLGKDQNWKFSTTALDKHAKTFQIKDIIGTK